MLLTLTGEDNDVIRERTMAVAAITYKYEGRLLKVRSQGHGRYTTSGSIDCCVETPLVNISTVAAAASSMPMSPLEAGAGDRHADWLDPAQWSPYRIRRSSYVIATQDINGPQQPVATNNECLTSPGARSSQSPPIFDDRRHSSVDRDLDLSPIRP